MSDHEFEKQVQRKMDEFKLRPSDAVWTAVEKNIRQTRPRRRFGFWLPVGVVIMATTGYLLFSGGLNNDKTPSIAQSKTVTEKNEHSSNQNITSNEKNSTQTTPVNNDEATTNDVDVNRQQQGAQPNGKNEANPVDQLQQSAQTKKSNETTPSHQQQQSTPVNKNNFDRQQQEVQTVRRNNTRPGQQRLVQSPAITRRNSNVTNPNTITLNDDFNNTLFAAMPQLAITDQDAIATSKAAPAALNKHSPAFIMPQNAALTPPIQKQRGPKWVFGAQANVGISRISQSNLFQVDGWLGSTEKSLAEDLSQRNANGGMLSTPGVSYNSFIATVPPAPKKPAVIRQGLSYSAGLYAQRPLSKRLRLTIGLNYAYMSAHTDIGKLVERPTIVNMGTASANVVSRYYTSADALVSTGNLNTQWQNIPDSMVLHNYTHRFHNIEIPVTINWQINKGRQLPPFVLDAGFSLSHLLSADALHYDGTKGIYYKNDKLFNKTFVNAILGLNVGLFQQSKTPVWIGPGLRYSLTGLLDKSVSNGQFVWSAGFNVRVQLSR